MPCRRRCSASRQGGAATPSWREGGPWTRVLAAFGTAWRKACGRWSRVPRLADAAGLAVAVVREDEVVARGFGVRDVGTGAPVTPETMFHLASVSKPFVATAIVRWPLPGTTGGRCSTSTPRSSSGCPSSRWPTDGRGGHGPGPAEPHERPPRRRGVRLARPAARRRRPQRVRPQPVGLAAAGGARLDVLLLQRRVRAARAGCCPGPPGTTFEDAVRQLVLAPLGMRMSTFLRAEVPAHLAASPHVGDAADGARGRLPLHPAPRPQLDPALQPGRPVSLDCRR